MAARKRTTASATSSGTPDITTANPRLELAKAINALSQKMEAFGKAAEGLASFTKDTLVEFDLQIQAKNEDLARLAEENDHTQKRLKTETTLFLAEFRYDGAKKVLSERNETPVPIADYEQMKATLTRLTAEREKDVENAVKVEKERARASLEAAVQMRELNHKAQTAELTATTNQQVKEIDSLKQTIANLKEEVAQQRKLTEAVANAGRQAPITLQTNGK
jgi:hypothetical protein